jgi:hypothetical protein
MTTPSTLPGTDAAEPPVWDASASPAASVEAEPQEGGEAKPAARTPLKAGPRRTNSVSILLAISALIAIGGISFAVGRVTTSSGTGTGTQNGAAGQFGPNASGLPGGFNGDGRGLGDRTATISGTVVVVAADSITVKLADGSTVTVATGSSTTYHNQTSGSSTDLAAGQTVQVQTSGGSNQLPGASASAATTTRTATDVTITAK